MIDPVAALTAVPAVLRPTPAAPRAAPLAGTDGTPSPSRSDGPLVPLAAAVAVAACLLAAASRLRRPRRTCGRRDPSSCR